MPAIRSAALVLLLAAALAGAGCTTAPRVQSQSSPDAQLERLRTFGFLEPLGTDRAGYASSLSQELKSAVTREMEARGYRLASEPDLLVNFFVEQRESAGGGPTVGVGIGGGWGSFRSGYGLGVGISDVLGSGRRTEGTLTIDVVDRARNQLVWSGTATGSITRRMREDPRSAIDAAVPRIFAEFPGRAAP